MGFHGVRKGATQKWTIRVYVLLLHLSTGLTLRVSGQLDDLSLAERESISSIPEAPPLDPKQNDKTIAIHTSHLPSKATTNAPAAAAADDPSESSVKKPTPPTVNTTLPPAPSKSKADADFDVCQPLRLWSD